MMDIIAVKNTLRHTMRNQRSGLSEASRRNQSEAASLLAEHEVLAPLRRKLGRPLTVFIYASFQDEPDTSYFMEQCWMQNDRVLVPRIVGAGQFTLHELHKTSDLLPGAWGIPEPGKHTSLWPEGRWQEIDLVVVPGLAFDKTGGRIGFGGGYYDRFMSKLKLLKDNGREMIVAAIVFQEQILAQRIPMEPHDFRVDLLFTAAGTIYIR